MDFELNGEGFSLHLLPCKNQNENFQIIILQCDFLKGLVLKEYGAQNSDIDLGIALRNKTIDLLFLYAVCPSLVRLLKFCSRT